MTASDVGKIEAGRLRAYPGQARKLARALGLEADNSQRLLEEVVDGANDGAERART
jgi:hypothetical protein